MDLNQTLGCMLEGNRTSQRLISSLSIVNFKHSFDQFQHIFGTTTVNESG